MVATSPITINKKHKTIGDTMFANDRVNMLKNAKARGSYEEDPDSERWITNCPIDLFREYADKLKGIFVKGRPKSTDHYTSEELENDGIVGMYRSRFEEDIQELDLENM